MVWEVEFTDPAREWIEALDDDDFDAMAGVIDLLEQHGQRSDVQPLTASKAPGTTT